MPILEVCGLIVLVLNGVAEFYWGAFWGGLVSRILDVYLADLGIRCRWFAYFYGKDRVKGVSDATNVGNMLKFKILGTLFTYYF